MRTKNSFHAAPALYIALAICAVLIPIKWLISWIFAVFVHEIAHYILLRACGATITGMDLDLGGMRLDTMDLYGWREVVCAAAGPTASFLLVSLSSVFPRVALCGFFQGLFNLLPIYPLDGGRILHGCVGKYRIGERIVDVTAWCVLILILIVSVWGWFAMSLGPVPLMFCLFLMVKSGKIKIPCKEGKQAVQ